MRIIGGTCRGRPLKTPKNNDIRPTTDKVRLAIFNALFSRGGVESRTGLDAFCGTGALGLEALSQGAGHMTFWDIARPSLSLAKDNAENLGLADNANFKIQDASSVKQKPETHQKFDLVFLDPPYRKELVPKTITALETGGWIADDAIYVIETEKDADLSGVKGDVLFDKLYGDTRVVFVSHKNHSQTN